MKVFEGTNIILKYIAHLIQVVIQPVHTPQQWPGIGEGGESASQGYTGGLPLSSHPGQQPHQMQHLVSGVISLCHLILHSTFVFII